MSLTSMRVEELESSFPLSMDLGLQFGRDAVESGKVGDRSELLGALGSLADNAEIYTHVAVHRGNPAFVVGAVMGALDALEIRRSNR